MNLTTAQKAVMATPAAMEIIAKEAKEFIASKFQCSLDDVDAALANGNDNAMRMFGKLVAKGVDEVAKLV